jgi:transposase
LCNYTSTYEPQQAVEKGFRFLKAQDDYFPDMKKKRTQTPVARRVFQRFLGIDLLTINEQQTLLLNIKDK